jgi:hypothetical protein
MIQEVLRNLREEARLEAEAEAARRQRELDRDWIQAIDEEAFRRQTEELRRAKEAEEQRLQAEKDRIEQKRKSRIGSLAAMLVGASR